MAAIELEPGLSGMVQTLVGPADLASALGSGDVAVLGTPRMIALAEAATVAALAGALGEGKTSVGTHIDMRHLAPTPQGGTVTANASLASVEGKALVFEVEVRDEFGPIGQGSVRRTIVTRASFEDRAQLPRT